LFFYLARYFFVFQINICTASPLAFSADLFVTKKKQGEEDLEKMFISLLLIRPIEFFFCFVDSVVIRINRGARNFQNRKKIKKLAG